MPAAESGIGRYTRCYSEHRSGRARCLEAGPTNWGSHGGRLFIATLNFLSLEVCYCLLPRYENTINQDSVDQGSSAPVANREIPIP